MKLTYNNAPDLLYWWLDGYVDFSAKQKPLIKQELNQLQQWHRHNELPKYAELMQNTANLMQRDVTPQQVCSVFDSAKTHIEQLNLEIAPIIESIAPDLSVKQLAHIEKKFGVDNEKWRDKWMDENLDKREKKRLDDAIDRAESFYGSINSDQKELLLKSIQTSSFKPEVSYQRRLEKQQAIMLILRGIEQGRLSGTQANSKIQSFMHEMTEPEDPEYSAYIDQLATESCQTIASLHKSATPKQRKTLQENLKGYLNDLNVLMSLQQP
ncbi:hypothetical protein ZMTM_06270 [Methyloradius palustris]|uniref:Uncharacterized protein n=1 Tax=Methyloradius palustris TaxID=2778876 RepID=A0A8D5G1I1_9PROT|nr:hypothetical protein ZMTM_06270 [Methyloradius palustris]